MSAKVKCIVIDIFPHAGKAQLRLNCSDSEAAIEVVTHDEDVALHSTNLTGRCITPEWIGDQLMEVLDLSHKLV